MASDTVLHNLDNSLDAKNKLEMEDTEYNDIFNFTHLLNDNIVATLRGLVGPHGAAEAADAAEGRGRPPHGV